MVNPDTPAPRTTIAADMSGRLVNDEMYRALARREQEEDREMIAVLEWGLCLNQV